MKHLGLLLITFFSLSAFASQSLMSTSALAGSYRGKVKIGNLPHRAAVLHIREVPAEGSERALIATLGVANDRGEFEGVNYFFKKFIPHTNAKRGCFMIEKMASGTGVGTQVVSLEITLGTLTRLHGELTSNLLTSDGELVESVFELDRSV